MDSFLRELIAVDSQQAFNFFLTGLKDVVGKRRVENDEMIYVASILAHYSQTSCVDTTATLPLSGLSGVFDFFVFSDLVIDDPEILEIGGSQILLFAGFFRDQVRHRHNVRWYDEIGQSFYDRASRLMANQKKQKLFEGLSESFPNWTIHCNHLSRTFRDNRFLLGIDQCS